MCVFLSGVQQEQITHSAVTQLLCRQDDGATLLPWNPSGDEKQKTKVSEEGNCANLLTVDLVYFVVLMRHTQQSVAHESKPLITF